MCRRLPSSASQSEDVHDNYDCRSGLLNGSHGFIKYYNVIITMRQICYVLESGKRTEYEPL